MGEWLMPLVARADAPDLYKWLVNGAFFSKACRQRAAPGWEDASGLGGPFAEEASRALAQMSAGEPVVVSRALMRERRPSQLLRGQGGRCQVVCDRRYDH